MFCFYFLSDELKYRNYFSSFQAKKYFNIDYFPNVVRTNSNQCKLKVCTPVFLTSIDTRKKCYTVTKTLLELHVKQTSRI